ncbi:MAG: hypothetical protein ACJA09_002436 [Alcanivorax sp.]|jgi:hypothetical protein
MGEVLTEVHRALFSQRLRRDGLHDAYKRTGSLPDHSRAEGVSERF